MREEGGDNCGIFLPQRHDGSSHFGIIQKFAACFYPLWEKNSLTFNFLKFQIQKVI
jgi:hypothetical protein